MQTLKKVNLSHNGLNIPEFLVMFTMLKPQAYNFNYLDVSWNSMSDIGVSHDILVDFRKRFASFLRYSRTLQHVDLQGNNFSEETLEHVSNFGFRKSKTLLSIHMSGNFDKEELLTKFRLWMKVIKNQRQEALDSKAFPSQAEESKASQQPEPRRLTRSGPIKDLEAKHFSGERQFNLPIKMSELENSIRDGALGVASEINSAQKAGMIHDYRPDQFLNVKKKLNANYADAMRDHNTHKLHSNAVKAKFKQAMRKGALEAPIRDRVVFQRFLGHYEILNGYRWHEVDESDCYLCNDWSYCVFLYDKNLARDEDIYHTMSAKSLGNAGSGRQKSILAPIHISIDSLKTVLPMIPIQHFLSRLALDSKKGSCRNLKDH